MAVTEVVPDDEALRLARRARLLDELEAAGVDVLVAGREANARYVSGAPRLWMAGSRPFGLGCVLVRATGAIHLLSTWDEGIPEEIPHERLYGISFNSKNFLSVLQGVEGAATAKVVATDALATGAVTLLGTAFPEAEIVDGSQLLDRARRVKTPDEVEAIRASVAVAERALATAEAALVGGDHRAAAHRRVHGGHGRRRRDHPGGPGRRLADLAGAALAPGRPGRRGRGRRPGGLRGRRGARRLHRRAGPDPRGRRRPKPQRRPVRPSRRSPRPPARRLRARTPRRPPCWTPTPRPGSRRPPFPVARGLGLGYDLPLVTAALPQTAAEQRLEVGMVLVLTTHVWEEGVGSVLGHEPVVVTPTGPELLRSTAP